MIFGDKCELKDYVKPEGFCSIIRSFTIVIFFAFPNELLHLERSRIEG
jgi:hypothetical protein